MYPILALTPKFIAQTPFNKLLQKHLLEKYNEIFGQYNCMVWFLHRSFAPDSRSAMVKRRSTCTIGIDLRLHDAMTMLNCLVKDFYLGGISTARAYVLVACCDLNLRL